MTGDSVVLEFVPFMPFYMGVPPGNRHLYRVVGPCSKVLTLSKDILEVVSRLKSYQRW